MKTIEQEGLTTLFQALRERGYTVLGPTVRDHAIVWDEIDSPADLPAGWSAEQEAGSYRLVRRDDEALFGFAVGPQAPKRFLFPAQLRLWRAERAAGNGSFRLHPEERPRQRLALFGLRPCELAAIAVQDRVFLGGEQVDPLYRQRRADAFLVVVQCGAPAGTCFCASMGTGPQAASGFDLALTEVLADGRHYFVAEAGSEGAEELLAVLPGRQTTDGERDAAAAVVERAAGRMGRRLETDGLAEALLAAYEHPHWEAVARRCLSCGNCTLVCPTCFCSTVEDASALAGGSAERWRRWDSCFSVDFSYLHGGSVRTSTASRYRQWLTHKLATWQQQFGTSGCVGCGRCISWCPVGIDITQEAAALRSNEGGQGARHA